MNKEMFLKELSDRLQILNEQERKELLEEYAQHIDLKIQNGLSEEEAVKDFGAPEELIAELLDVYHINSEYAAQSGEKKKLFEKIPMPKLRKEADNTGEKTEEQIAREQEEKRLKEEAKRIKDEERKARSEERKQKNEAKRAKVLLWKEECKKKREEKRRKRQERQAGSFLGRLVRSAEDFVIWSVLIFWKFCLICMAAPMVFVGLLALFGTGMVAVLLMQGYPLIGITLIAAGVFLASAGVTGLILSYVFSGSEAIIVQKKCRFRVGMIVLLLAGVLTGGIGTGAAFEEFSDVEYNGTVWLGGENTEETTLIYEMQKGGLDQIYFNPGMHLEKEPEIVADKEVPLDEVWFEVEYDPAGGEPVLEKYGAYENGAYLREDIHMWLYGGRYDEFELVMEIKDQVLEELKEKKLSSYRYAPVVQIKVLIHPQNKDKLRIV